MIPLLKPVHQHLWLGATVGGMLTAILSIAAYEFAQAKLAVDVWVIAVGVGLIILSISLAFGKIAADRAIGTTDFLARAILLVAHTGSGIEPPNPDTLPASRDFLNRLAQSVYNMAHEAESFDENGMKGEAFKTMFDVMPVPVISIDADGIVGFANDAAARYIGTPASELIGHPFDDVISLSFISDLTLENWLKDVRRSAVTAEETWERVRLHRSDETRRQFDLAAHFSKSKGNNLETVLVFFDRTRIYEHDDHDLTFVSLAVHELRTPLTIMRGYIEVFEDELSDKLTSEQSEFMHNMSASAQRLSSFVANILNVVRVDENAMTLAMKEETWSDLLMSACKDIDLRARVHGKVLEFRIAENLPTVAVDKVSIFEVINNLVDNAIKYTHTDESIIIAAYEKNGFVETTVTDKGVGIPPSLLPHIFEKFYRAHTSKNSVGGTGLGLYLSRAIIKAHGGQMWVNTKEGQGSTFGFSVPVYANVAKELKPEDGDTIIRGAHGWIKNHTIYRG